MARKTPLEKLRTKLNNLLQNENIVEENGAISVNEGIQLFTFDEEAIYYGRNRYYPTKKEEIAEEDFSVRIPLNDENLSLLSSNITNPPKRARQIIDLLRSISGQNYSTIIIGANENSILEDSVSLTKELFDFLVNIDKEEATNKRARFLNRIGPSITNELGLEVEEVEENINYSLLFQEVIERGEFTQQDIQRLANQLEVGENNQVVIESRINRQVEWLIDTIEDILEIDKLNTPDAKQVGADKFGFTKVSVTGPEHLMEKILTEFGQFTLFGVPALLNTDKYVIREGMPRVQFDLVLIDHLGEVEIVELKRPDKHLLDYDSGRNKFYPSKDLAVAISQTERYLSAVYDKNDEEQQINGQTLREFINDQIGETLSVQSIRPRGIIIMGSYQKICKPYMSLSLEKRNRITEEAYRDNSVQAYKEVKDSLKNIKIITYSELLETARTRLNIERGGNEEEE